MSLRVAARLARRELRGGLRGFRIFLGCVILGVAAIAAVGTLRDSVRAGLATQGAELLGGDAEIALTYRFASQTERAWMAGAADRVSEIADFRSMAVAGDARELTQVKAVDAAYPLVGAVGLAPDMPLAQALAGTGGLPGAVMEPVLATRLGIAVGEEFRLGEQRFVLMAEITHEPDPRARASASGRAASLRAQPSTGPGCSRPARSSPRATGSTCPRGPISTASPPAPRPSFPGPARAGPMPATPARRSRSSSPGWAPFSCLWGCRGLPSAASASRRRCGPIWPKRCR